MNKIKKIPWSTVYLIVTILAVIFFGFANNQFSSVLDTMSSLSAYGLIMAAVLQIAFVVTEALIIFFLVKKLGDSVQLRSCAKVALIGLYYCSITPSATGGQPAQVAYLKRDNGINVASSVATLSLKFFTYQVAIVTFGVIALVFMYDKIVLDNSGLIPIIIFGLIVNSAWISIFVPMLFSKKFLAFLCKLLRKIINKIKFIKKKEKYISSVDSFEIDFAMYSARYRKNKKVVIVSIIFSFPEVLMQMGVLYFVFVSFGNVNHGFIEITAMQVLLQASVSFMPMPGAAGAQEIGFAAYLSPYFPESQMFAAVLVWRFFTYYSIIISGALLIVVDELINRKKRREKIVEM